MSELTERKNAISIEGLNWQNCQQEIASMTTVTSISTIKSIFPELLSTCSQQVIDAAGITRTDATSSHKKIVISSPATLQNKFVQPFHELIRELKAHNLDPVQVKQAAAIRTLSEMNYVITHPDKVKHHIRQALTQDNIEQVDKSFKAAFHELNAGHTTFFTSTVASLCKTASITCGFHNVSVKQRANSDTLLVTALNDKGEGLISEICVDKNHMVNTTTEVTGIHDGSCTKVMAQFNDELKRMGVKYQNEQTWRSPTVTRNEYIRQLERTRKLNQQNQIRH